VFVVSNYTNQGGWVYVFVLLLAAMLIWPKFTSELNGLMNVTPNRAPQPGRPGQPF
jgi:hypothetical protein